MTNTTLGQIQLLCPACNNQFVSRTAKSKALYKETDFREVYEVADIYACNIHTCLNCGYSAIRKNFNKNVEIFWETLRKIEQEIYPLIEIPYLDSGSSKYRAAAMIAGWQYENSWNIAHLYLKAAWCAVEEKDPDTEKELRIEAACLFEKALLSYDEVPRSERAATTYLIGELWRRIGNEEVQSNEWFCRVRLETTDDPNQSHWEEFARIQMIRPGDRFFMPNA